jgi:CheY-like chemotaxis protein
VTVGLTLDTSLPKAPVVSMRCRSGARVLLAEDEPINRMVAEAMLLEAGVAVDLARDGQQALEMAKMRSYDLIFLDLQMPRLDGMGAARAIRALPLHAHTPILALTASAFVQDRVECLAAGMDGHIVKPVEAEVLMASLVQFLGT